MNILFITQLFPADREAKHTSEALREFIEEWGRSGHHVKVIRPYFRYETEPFPVPSRFTIGDRIDVGFVRPFRIPLLKLSWYNHKKIIKKLQMKPDVIICHLYNAYFTFHRLARELGVPLIIGIHMSDIQLAKNRFHRWRQKKIFKDAAAFACRSYAYQRSFLNLFPEYADRTFPALSGIPAKYLEWSKRNPSFGMNRIISVGWLYKRKQIDKVLEVLAQLPEQFVWEYTIVGSGEEEQPLKRKCHELGLTEKVRFEGELKRDEVIKELTANDIFILPSYNETLGLVYLEAMACGCITIGARNEGIDGIIEDGENGFLCEAGSGESIKQKLVQALQLTPVQKENMIKKSLQTIREFSVEHQARKYLENINKYRS
ncbi:MAG: glycosyltransferase [Mangrovibacterium sp.]